MLLKLKRNAFNSSHSSSSISIQQYTFCDDLNDQFDAAVEEHVCSVTLNILFVLTLIHTQCWLLTKRRCV